MKYTKKEGGIKMVGKALGLEPDINLNCVWVLPLQTDLDLHICVQLHFCPPPFYLDCKLPVQGLDLTVCLYTAYCNHYTNKNNMGNCQMRDTSVKEQTKTCMEWTRKADKPTDWQGLPFSTF